MLIKYNKQNIYFSLVPLTEINFQYWLAPVAELVENYKQRLFDAKICCKEIPSL